MFDINRCLLIVKPKQPFFDWVQSVDHDDDLTLDYIREDSTAYLVPEYELNSEQAEILEWCFELLFEVELDSWYIDPNLWPQERNLKMFLEWFDVEFHSMVVDLGEPPIEIIDYGPDDPDSNCSNGN
jgi:hypothetical protein